MFPGDLISVSVVSSVQTLFFVNNSDHRLRDAEALAWRHEGAAVGATIISLLTVAGAEATAPCLPCAIPLLFGIVPVIMVALSCSKRRSTACCVAIPLSDGRPSPKGSGNHCAGDPCRDGCAPLPATREKKRVQYLNLLTKRSPPRCRSVHHGNVEWCVTVN